PPDSSLHRLVRRLWPGERVTRNKKRLCTGFNVGTNGSKGFCAEGALSLPPELVCPRLAPWLTECVRRCGAPLASEGSLARSQPRWASLPATGRANASGEPQRVGTTGTLGPKR